MLRISDAGVAPRLAMAGGEGKMVYVSWLVIWLVIFGLLAIVLYLLFGMKPKYKITPPKFNNPSLDVVVTETTPLLSFFNSQGGQETAYEIEIDTKKEFDSPNLLTFKKIEEKNKYVTDIKVDSKKPLKDKSCYYWRIRAIDANGIESDWATSRFYVDTQSDDKFMNLLRAEVQNIKVSNGYNAKNIIDYDDPGLVTYWQSTPPEDKISWVEFDFGKVIKISRIWMLSNPTDSDGWLKNFYFEVSLEGKRWKKIEETQIKNNDTFRNIINFKSVSARYARLVINEFIGYAAQINEIIFYTPGKPELPKIPSNDYVLIVGNEHNGFTFTDLARHIEKMPFGLKTVTVPYFEVSLEMIDKLARKPKAIILSGNNADYPNLPMFEHNGEFEIIRKSNIPILGICAGHQFLAMAYGYTRARSMGWSDISAIEPKTKMTHIKIKKDDPIFQNIPDNFIGPEIHSWAVVEPAEEFEVIAESTYVQAKKSAKRFIYGAQFHGEINVDYNQGKPYIENFLRMVIEKGRARNA